MKFKLNKTETNYSLTVVTKLTPAILDAVSSKAKTVYEDDKPVFKIEASEAGEADLGRFGMIIPGKSFIVLPDSDVDMDTARMQLGKIKKYADTAEKQVLAEYKELQKSAESIEVETVEEGE